jgi:hypothetical protein
LTNPPHERTELEALVWPDWDRPLATGADTPPGVPEKLAEAMAGRFVPGNPANIDRILANLG